MGQTATIVVTVRNQGTSAAPAITMLLFTFERPFFGTLLSPTACNGCQLHENAGLWAGAEWDNLAPGDHRLEVTIKAIGRTNDGLDASGAHQWLCAMYAEPYAKAGAGPIDTSVSLALATGATVINP